MIDEKDQHPDDLPIFQHAISVEDLKRQDPSVTLTCERLGDGQIPLGFWRTLLTRLGLSGGKAE